LLDYSPTGAFGVIVNRPTGVGLSDLLPALESVPGRLDRVHLGGPVEPGRMVFLMRSASAPLDSRHVFADIHATSSASELRGAIERDESPERFRAYVGYAGWSPGQLDDEVARGDWHVVPAEPGQVFDPAMGDLWDRLVQDHEGLPIQWRSPTPQFRQAPTWDAL
jgi:putative transcriptional regulator